MRGSVDSIKERLDIVEVVGAYLKLEKAGASYKGRCPFHNEKTPSFFASSLRQNYYCFGCGAKGDMFTFIQEVEGVDFKGALTFLAEKAGITLEPSNTHALEEQNEKEKILAVLEEATLFFEDNLRNSAKALEYIKNRGIAEETIKTWRIGMAEDEWRSLSTYLKHKGFTEEYLLKAGLVKRSEEKVSEPYDVFRGRVMFPLFDATGRVIAFSGRALDPKTEPKYLNTPETVLFQKSETLYGLHKAKEEIRKKDFAVLVEGQIDLVLSHQAGIKNTVASSGTAFTEAHLERLKRLSHRIILGFDGDNAGKKASENSARLGLSLGMEVKIAALPEGKDPADLLSTSPDTWKEILRRSVHAIEALLTRILQSEQDHRKAGKAIVKEVLPLLTLLESSVERAHFVSLIAKRSGIKEEVLWDDLRRTPPLSLVSVQAQPFATKDAEIEKTVEKLPRKQFIERRLVGVLVWQKTIAQSSIDTASLEADIKRIVGEEYLLSLIDHLSSEREALIFETESYYKDSEVLSTDIQELLGFLEREMLHEDLLTTMRELSLAEAEKNEVDIERLGQHIHKTHQRMRELEQKSKVV
jgi:DNA primase